MTVFRCIDEPKGQKTRDLLTAMMALAVLVVVICFSGYAQARSDTPLPSLPLSKPVAMPAVEVADPAVLTDVADGQVIKIPVNQSRVIELSESVRDVVVSNAEIADVMVRRPKQVFILAKAVGQTNVFLMDGDGDVLRRLEIRSHVDVDTLGATLTGLMPEERIKVASVGGAVFLSGNVRSQSAAANAQSVARRFVTKDEEIVNLLKISDEQQVLLRVRVAEVQKSAMKELGIFPTIPNHNTNYATNVAPLNATGSSIFNTFNSTMGAGMNSFSPPTYFGQIFMPFAFGNKGPDFTLMIDALEQHGLISTLAEPNLTSISGETAKMLAGGEFPVPTSSSNGSIGIEFKPFGVALGFTPIVVAPGRISLKMSSEVSAIDPSVTVAIQGTQIHGLKVRRADTSVELASGASLMIAGMLQNDMTEALNGMPGIMDIPILGALFRSSSFQRRESELVIMVTAYVVQPQDNNRLALPTDGMVPASDLELYLLGRLFHVYAGGGPPPAESVQGPIGYIMQ
ncbi:MAG: type II and III secretion system protein family protein [Alphaproteobacteria bacterium]